MKTHNVPIGQHSEELVRLIDQRMMESESRVPREPSRDPGDLISDKRNSL
jgi:hypothetical protein